MHFHHNEYPRCDCDYGEENLDRQRQRVGNAPRHERCRRWWSVTYALQRSTTPNDGNSWKWLSEYGADIDSPFANDAGELASSLLKATISGTGADATATFENLPKTDVNGKEYTYRLVEKVVGSYKVEGAPVGSSVDGKVQLVAVGVGANAPGASCQTFTNALNTVDISGTKRSTTMAQALRPRRSTRFKAR